MDHQLLQGLEHAWSENALSLIRSGRTRDPDKGVTYSRMLENGNLHWLFSFPTQRRRGWIQNAGLDVESVPEHMYSMGIFAFMFEDAIDEQTPNLDWLKIDRMIHIHDLAESRTEDYTPLDRVSPALKKRQEQEALGHIFDKRHWPSTGFRAAKTLRALWDEYEERRTPEAKLVKDLDLFQMQQVAFYLEQTRGVYLPEFICGPAQRIQHPVLKEAAAQTRKKHLELIRSHVSKIRLSHLIEMENYFEELDPKARHERHTSNATNRIVCAYAEALKCLDRPREDPLNLICVDLGCGNGDILHSVSRMLQIPSVNCLGIEKKEMMSPHDNHKYISRSPSEIKIEYITEDRDGYSFLPDKSVDLLRLWMVAQHVADVAFLLKESRRILRNGGLLIVREHDCRSIEDAAYLDKYHRTYSHNRTYGAAELAAVSYLSRNVLVQKLMVAGFYLVYQDESRINDAKRAFIHVYSHESRATPFADPVI